MLVHLLLLVHVHTVRRRVRLLEAAAHGATHHLLLRVATKLLLGRVLMLELLLLVMLIIIVVVAVVLLLVLPAATIAATPLSEFVLAELPVGVALAAVPLVVVVVVLLIQEALPSLLFVPQKLLVHLLLHLVRLTAIEDVVILQLLRQLVVIETTIEVGGVGGIDEVTVLLPRYVNVVVVIVPAELVVAVLVKVVAVRVVEGAIWEIVETEVVVLGSVNHRYLPHLIHRITVSIQLGSADEFVVLVVVSLFFPATATTLGISALIEWHLVAIILLFVFFFFLHCCLKI